MSVPVRARGRARGVALAALIALAGLTIAIRTAPAGDDWTARLVARADVIAAKVSKLRGLKIKRPIAKGVMTDAQLRARILARMDEDSPPAERAAEAANLKRWGLVDLDTDVDALMVDLLTEQIAGFYDPKEKKLYVAAKPETDETWADMLMAHEIVHALQDQHYDLDKWMKPVADNSDASAARTALVEGDGVALMLEYVLDEQGLAPPWAGDDVARILTAGMDSAAGGDLLAQAPLAIRESMVFPYRAGVGFVAHLRRRQPWSRIDRAFRRPPRSTEQILHPELYLADDRPDRIEAPVSIPDPGLALIHQAVWGEAGWALFLRSHGVADGTAASAAAGWGGDRIALYGGADAAEHPERALGIAVLTWDTDLDALEFWSAAGDALDDMVTGARVESSGDLVRWLGADGQVTVAERRGRRVVIVTGAGLAGWRGFVEGAWRWKVKVAPGHAP